MPLLNLQRYLSRLGPLIIDELGDVPRSPTGADLLFDEWTDVFGSERLTGALLDRLTHPRPHLGDKRQELPSQAQ